MDCKPAAVEAVEEPDPDQLRDDPLRLLAGRAPGQDVDRVLPASERLVPEELNLRAEVAPRPEIGQ